MLPAEPAPREPARRPAARAPILEVRALRKSFGRRQVLKGIDLSVLEGELVFLVGPSGSGKSTLLRCCSGLENASGGSIRIEGVDAPARSTSPARLRRHVGFVFPSPNLYPHMTALDNVTLALRKVMKLAGREADRRGRAMLDRVGLSGQSDAYPHQLSAGRQQCVSIARALALEPAIMLFDDPTGGLDPELAGGVLNVMRAIRRPGTTMLVASHELSFAREAADRVIFIDAGEIVEEGRPHEILRQARDKRTRVFLQKLLAG